RAQDPDLVALDEERREERQPLDVVEMRMRQQDRQRPLALAELAPHQLLRQLGRPGPEVDQQPLLRARDQLHRRGVAAVAQELATRHRERAAHSPEPDLQVPSGPTIRVIPSDDVTTLIPRFAPCDRYSAAMRSIWSSPCVGAWWYSTSVRTCASRQISSAWSGVECP